MNLSQYTNRPLLDARLATAKMWAKRDLLCDDFFNPVLTFEERQNIIDMIDETGKAALYLDWLAGRRYIRRNSMSAPVAEETAMQHKLDVCQQAHPGTW
jgi:hypothetical protein